ncbi:MAG: amidohydrolase family protein [Planctomycetes bacterium]|nr:amidohydrolase family protein [Planctomycetota bacterium]
MSSFALFLSLLPGVADRPLAIRAEHVLLGDGRTLEPGVVVIEGGKLQHVGAEKDVDVPAGAGRIDHKGWLSAGLIGLHGYSTATGELRDTTRTTLPEARVAWAFDARHPELRDLLAEGVTSFVLTPSPSSLSGGASAFVKCAGGKIVTREAQLSLGFSDQNLSFNRFPTSHGGALAELERLFAKPTGTIEKCAQGELSALFEVETPSDVHRAIDFAKRHKLVGALSGADWTGEVAKDVKASGLSVVASTLRVGEDRRTLRAMVALGAADVPFGFGLDAPFSHPATLRLSAALCIREGLARDKAWRGLTAESARIAGVEKRVGNLAEGLDADLVLWSGDPLELSSSVVAVYVDGERAFAAEER